MGGPGLVRQMLELLAAEEDETCSEWSACIAAELVAAADRFIANRFQRSLLVYALQLPAIAPFRIKHFEASKPPFTHVLNALNIAANTAY